MAKSIFISLLTCLIIVSNVQAVTIVCEEVKSGGTRLWSGNIEFPCWFPDGETCKVTKYPVVDMNSVDIIELVAGGYKLSGKFTWIGLETVGLTPSQATNANLNGFSFFEDEFKIKIIDGGDYQELNGVSIDLGGTVLNELGEFQIYIPPVQ